MSAIKTATVGNNLTLLFTGTYCSTTGTMAFAGSGLTVTMDKIVDSTREGIPATGAMKVVLSTKQYDEGLYNFLNAFGTSNNDRTGYQCTCTGNG